MQISQLPIVEIGKFQCLSHREFPEFFKTYPTLIYRSIAQASKSIQTNRQCYLITLVDPSVRSFIQFKFVLSTWALNLLCSLFILFKLLFSTSVLSYYRWAYIVSLSEPKILCLVLYLVTYWISNNEYDFCIWECFWNLTK